MYTKVNLRKKYSKHSGTSKKNSPYKFQLDFYHNGKRMREVISDVEFLPTDTKEQREQKKRIVDKIKADLEIELANKSTGLLSRELKMASFINFFKEQAKKKSPNTKVAWDNTLNYIIELHGNKLKFVDITENWLE
ncbi:Arm DNA-binding domain-containing protein [Gaetbulibacter saemankumensis]|uniref:Arm DNA-binding domain-containing protein n=1 Tax=Gaetbulibacter saemankumensis TaxID=311208 RepID=UPI00373FE377